MELLYLFIGSYKNIQNQGFCFSNEFEIKFDKEEKKLSILKSQKPKLNLFNDSFLNISAIIGKNGSGKSNLLNFIKLLFTNMYFQAHDYVFIAKQSDDSILVVDKLSNEDEKVINDKKLEDGTRIFYKQIVHKMSEDTTLACFSNSLSIYEHPEVLGREFEDLSLSYRLNYFSKESNKKLIDAFENIQKSYRSASSEKKDIELTKSRLIRGILPERELYFSDLRAKISFITKYETKSWGFLPKSLHLTFDANFFIRNRENFLKLGLKDELLKNIGFILFDQVYQGEGIKQFKNRLRIHIFLYILKQDLDFLKIREFAEKTITELNTSLDIRDVPIIILEFLNELECKDPHNIYGGLFDFIKSFESEFDSYKNYHFWQHEAIFPINNHIRETLEKIFNFWQDQDFLFYFDWIDLSAGESALLTLFSNLHRSSQLLLEGNSIWLLIDEGDLYLHPEWQRTFFAELHKYLPLFFKEKNIKVQLFLTSHSPFIVSDLPKDNIILLDRDENRLCKVVDKEQFRETFGANIHTLFSDAFFMDELIGKFTKEKIDETLDFCKRVETEQKKKSSNYTKLKKEYKDRGYRKVQALIGEEYLRNIIGNHLEEAEAILKIKNPELELEMKKLADKFGKDELENIMNRL